MLGAGDIAWEAVVVGKRKLECAVVVVVDEMIQVQINMMIEYIMVALVLPPMGRNGERLWKEGLGYTGKHLLL